MNIGGDKDDQVMRLEFIVPSHPHPHDSGIVPWPPRAPIRSDAFAAYPRGRYDLIREDFIDYVRRSVQ
jgi:hypothetical protein